MLSFKLSLIATLSSLSLLASALPPHYPDLVSDGNRWTITAYDDSSVGHTQWATQGICFYPAGTQGTHQLYRWASDTYPDWNGRAVQEGDQVFLYGDFWRDTGHDGVQFEIVTNSPRSEGYGHWQEWIEDGKQGITVGFLNTKLTRVGKCRSLTFSDALDLSVKLDAQYTDEKELIVTPLGLTEKRLQQIIALDQANDK